MLKITLLETISEQRWSLHGALTDCSVAHLLLNWQAKRAQQSAERRIVDLDGLSVIDRSGQRVLSIMIYDGAQFIGIYATYLLKALHECRADDCDLD